MTTWTCKGAVAALALTALAGCEDGQGGSFLDSLSDTSAKPVAVSQAKMAFGAVTLVAPQGYCIDASTLKQSFALMARCDALGAPSASGSAPVGLITASVSKARNTLPTPDETATALSLIAVTDAQTRDDSVIFRARGPAPAEGLSERHWRATARIGTQTIGLALYGPTDGRAVSSEGRSVLRDLIDALADTSEG